MGPVDYGLPCCDLRLSSERWPAQPGRSRRKTRLAVRKSYRNLSTTSSTGKMRRRLRFLSSEMMRVLGGLWVVAALAWATYFGRGLVWAILDFHLLFLLIFGVLTLGGLTALRAAIALMRGRKRALIVLSWLAMPVVLYASAHMLMVGYNYGYAAHLIVSYFLALCIVTWFWLFFCGDVKNKKGGHHLPAPDQEDDKNAPV